MHLLCKSQMYVEKMKKEVLFVYMPGDMGVVREPRKGLLTGLCQPIGWKQICAIWDSTLSILIYCVTEDVIRACMIACIMKDCTLVWIRVLLTPGIYMP